MSKEKKFLEKTHEKFKKKFDGKVFTIFFSKENGQRRYSIKK